MGNTESLVFSLKVKSILPVLPLCVNISDGGGFIVNG